MSYFHTVVKNNMNHRERRCWIQSLFMILSKYIMRARFTGQIGESGGGSIMIWASFVDITEGEMNS